MHTSDAIVQRLAKSKKYRSQFVSAQARRAFAFQLRAIMKKRGLSQKELAEKSGLTQGVISRASDPNYGKLTITVIVKIANGLDMAYLGVLVPHSAIANWVANLSEDAVQVPTFEEEFGNSDLGAIPDVLSEDEQMEQCGKGRGDTASQVAQQGFYQGAGMVH